MEAEQQYQVAPLPVVHTHQGVSICVPVSRQKNDNIPIVT